MPTPGAPRSTVLAPYWLKLASAPGLVDGSDGDDVRVVVARGVRGRDVVVRAGVARSRDEQDAGGVGAADGIVQCPGVAAAAPAVVGRDEVQVVPGLEVGEVVDGLDGVGQRSSVGSQELAR
jgi:hypothetical protein